MRFNIVAIGDKVPKWVNENFIEYIQRIANDWDVNLITLSPIQRSKSKSRLYIKQEETKKLLASIPNKNLIVALDENGKSLSSKSFSKQVNHWSIGGRDVCFLIGGPDGLDFSVPLSGQKKLKKISESKWPDFCWSLSSLTFPHTLVRIILAEQLYRAWSIKMGHPYHRD